jgi:hypothetical protein
MADERDPNVSQRYRELGGEEPSRELDQVILSAARRSVEHQHAPLVTPSGRHRWYFSLGAAAVIVLAVAVTYQMQQEQPDPYASGVPQQETKPAAPPAETPPKPATDVTPQGKREAPAPRAPRPAAAPPVFVPKPPPRAEEAPRREAPATTQPESSGAPGAAAPEIRMQRDAAPARSVAKPMQAPAAETPERMLERIVELRKQGKNEEAERLLAEFKRRYPDYRIPENVVRP